MKKHPHFKDMFFESPAGFVSGEEILHQLVNHVGVMAVCDPAKPHDEVLFMNMYDTFAEPKPEETEEFLLVEEAYDSYLTLLGGTINVAFDQNTGNILALTGFGTDGNKRLGSVLIREGMPACMEIDYMLDTMLSFVEGPYVTNEKLAYTGDHIMLTIV